MLRVVAASRKRPNGLLLAKVLGTTAEFWLNLQLVNDLWLAEHNEVLAEKLEHARPLATCLE